MKFKSGFWKKITAMGLAGLVLIPAASCGSFKTDPNKVWHEENVENITLFCNDWEQFNNGKAVKSPVYKEIKKVAGCDITAKSVGSETYYSTLDFQRNKGELCEMFIIDGPTSPKFYNNLIRDEEIIPISDYVNESTKNKYPYLYDYMQQYEYMKKNISYAKGKSWFIPCKWTNDKSLYVRRDWIKNLNNKIDDILLKDNVVSDKSQITDAMRTQYKFNEEGPSNLLEFYRLSRAFTLYDPDNNNQNDTYGYVTEENRDMDSWINVAYDSPWKMWVKDETGNYINTNTSQGAMMAASLLNKMISEGYVSSEVVTKTVGNKQEDFANGKAGMMYAHNWYNVISAMMMSATNGLTISGARERILIMNPVAGKDGAFGGQGDIEYYRGWCIRSGMSVERLEACLKLMEYLHSPQGLELVHYGVYGENWEWKDDIEGGEKVSLCEPDGQGFIQSLRWTDSAAFIEYLTYTPPEAEALLTNGDILVERSKANLSNMILSDYPDLYTKTSINYLSGAYDYYDETVLKMAIDNTLAANWTFDAKTWATDGWEKLYMVSSSFQSQWNKYVSSYNSTYKGSVMEKEYNEAIHSGNVVKRTEK